MRILVLLPLAFLLSATLITDKGKYILINNKKQYYEVKGKGVPLLVFITGLGVELTDFNEISDTLCKSTTTFTYDRAGIGKSESYNNERNLENICSELNALLTKTKYNKPCILVAHSRGGAIARYYVNKYPKNVSGMVLIDPAIPEFKWEKRKLRTEEEKIEFDQRYLSLYCDTCSLPPIIKNEFKNTFQNDSIALSNINFPKNIPISILVSTQTTDEKYSKQDIEVKLKLVQEYPKQAPQIKLIYTDKAGHFIYEDQPELVVDVIKEMIEKVRSKN